MLLSMPSVTEVPGQPVRCMAADGIAHLLRSCLALCIVSIGAGMRTFAAPDLKMDNNGTISQWT